MKMKRDLAHDVAHWIAKHCGLVGVRRPKLNTLTDQLTQLNTDTLESIDLAFKGTLAAGIAKGRDLEAGAK